MRGCGSPLHYRTKGPRQCRGAGNWCPSPSSADALVSPAEAQNAWRPLHAGGPLAGGGPGAQAALHQGRQRLYASSGLGWGYRSSHRRHDSFTLPILPICRLCQNLFSSVCFRVDAAFQLKLVLQIAAAHACLVRNLDFLGGWHELYIEALAARASVAPRTSGVDVVPSPTDRDLPRLPAKLFWAAGRRLQDRDHPLGRRQADAHCDILAAGRCVRFGAKDRRPARPGRSLSQLWGENVRHRIVFCAALSP